jgi:hypothetical protein
MNQKSFIYLPNSSNHIDYSNQNIIYDGLLEEIKKDIDDEGNDGNDFDDSDPIIFNSLSSVLIEIDLIKNNFTSIDISNNRLLSEGLVLLVDKLKNNKNLKYISIANNNATSSGIFNFLIKILDFDNIPYVDIRGNFGSDLACVKKVLDNIDPNKQIEFKKKIIWYGTEEFRWS